MVTQAPRTTTKQIESSAIQATSLLKVARR
jgi:hypothetical protein